MEAGGNVAVFTAAAGVAADVAAGCPACGAVVAAELEGPGTDQTGTGTGADGPPKPRASRDAATTALAMLAALAAAEPAAAALVAAPFIPADAPPPAIGTMTLPPFSIACAPA